MKKIVPRAYESDNILMSGDATMTKLTENLAAEVGIRQV